VDGEVLTVAGAVRTLRHHPAVQRIPQQTRRGVAGILLAFLALGLMNVAAVPPLRPVDESAHVSYALMLTKGRLPRLDDQTVRSFPHMRRRPINTANHPPLLYAIVAVPLEAGIHLDQPVLGLRLARITSMLFAVAAVIGAARLAWLVLPGRRDVPVIAAAVTALTPIVPHTTALVYNDAIGLAASTWLLVAGMTIFWHGATRRRVILLMLAAAFAALARTSSLFALAPAVILAGYGVRRWRPALGIGGLTVGAAALAGGWWYVRNKHLYGTFTGSGFLPRPSGQEFPKRPKLDVITDVRVWRYMMGRLWDGFSGQRNLAAWSGWWGAAVEVPVLVGLAIGLWRAVARRARPSRDSVVLWGALGLFALTVFLSVVDFVSIGGNAFARYWFPLLPVAGILVGLGYGYLPRLLAPAALVVVAIANVALLHRYVIANSRVPSDTWLTAEIQALRGAGLRGASILAVLALVALVAGIALAASVLWSRDYPAGTAESRATSAA
jgi:4-amino-4-deoxy-L-arabinose transferase-like glycosyltransferase